MTLRFGLHFRQHRRHPGTLCVTASLRVIRRRASLQMVPVPVLVLVLGAVLVSPATALGTAGLVRTTCLTQVHPCLWTGRPKCRNLPATATVIAARYVANAIPAVPLPHLTSLPRSWVAPVLRRGPSGCCCGGKGCCPEASSPRQKGASRDSAWQAEGADVQAKHGEDGVAQGAHSWEIASQLTTIVEASHL